MTQTQRFNAPSGNPLMDSSLTALTAGDLEAIFLPAHGMLGISLRHQGVEILRRREDLEAAATKGSTAGIPLLYPWANRLAAPRYETAGQSVELDPASPLLHFDANGLPIHGVPWSRLAWDVTESHKARLTARLDWSSPERLAVFPFPHQLTITAIVQSDSLTLETEVFAGQEGPVPVSLGFHPYIGVPGLPRAQWRLSLPAMRQLVLDKRGIPTGREEDYGSIDGPLGERDIDDGFALIEEHAVFSISGGGRCIFVEPLEGFRYAQVFSPKDADYIALEPMTAPANALISGEGLRLVEPGGRLGAVFRIRIGSDAKSRAPD